MLRHRRASLRIVLLAAWAGGSPCPATLADAARPAEAAPGLATAEQIATAIEQLDDGDFNIRQRATRALWNAGPAAEPALRAALEKAGPETAARIRTILSNLAYGLTPDAPAEVAELVARYRTGTGTVQRQVADALAQRGAAGARVLLRLRARERDPAVRSVISEVLLRRAGELAAALIGEGEAATAGELLAAAAETGDQLAARNYAAFLLVRGGLDEQIAATKAKLDKVGAPGDHAASSSVLLTFLYRAKGDLPAARAAAVETGDDDLLRNVLIELGDWRELAARAAAAVDEVDLEALSFAAAFHRLAGDAAGADRSAGLLRAVADREPHNSELAAEGLFLNGHVELGMDVLSRHNHLARAVEFNTQRLAFDSVPRLLERARVRDGPDLRQVEAGAARAMWYAGDGPGAARLLADAATGCERRRDFDGFMAVIEAAHDMGLAERAQWYTVGALRIAASNPAAVAPAEQRDPLAEMFGVAKMRDAARAAAWWRLLRQRFPKQPAGHTLEAVKAIDARRMTGGDLQALCDASADFIAKLPPEERSGPLELIADTLADAGRREAAAARYEELAGLAESIHPARAAAALSKLADFDADAGRWQAAADRYLQAWSRDRTQPTPLYLSGWALARAGDASTGNQRMERAHLIPLADQDLRHALYEALTERKLTDEARGVRDVILKTAGFMSWRRSEALRRAGDDAYAAGKATAAADLWERAFLDNNDADTKFVEAWANVSMPALIRRTRAVGLVQDGNVPAAMEEANECLAMLPGDADSLIEIVAALDAAGHKAEADALYRRATAPYEALRKLHPQSGPLHNLCAWAAAKCKRDLDAALAHATRAVELQPANTASLDTLAEAHFARGEFRAALAAMRRCAELEPDDPRHHEQIARFGKAAEAAAK